MYFVLGFRIIELICTAKINELGIEGISQSSKYCLHLCCCCIFPMRNGPTLLCNKKVSAHHVGWLVGWMVGLCRGLENDLLVTGTVCLIYLSAACSRGHATFHFRGKKCIYAYKKIPLTSTYSQVIPLRMCCNRAVVFLSGQPTPDCICT